jgi:micrococcal nuclease
MRPREAFASMAVSIAALGLAGSIPGAALAEPACPAATTEAGTVVTDVTSSGALITESGEEVVLAGLAFPQVSDVKSLSVAKSGLAAAIARLAAGPVRVAPASTPDRYGRIRADVLTRDGAWLQGALVAAGLALVRPEDGGNGECLRALLALERAAAEAGAGLWADARIVAKATDESSLLAEIGLYALVEGRVVSVGYGTRMVFVDFGRRFRTDFTVLVPKTLVPRLAEAGIAVESLAGQEIRVRGVIEESGGPAIRLTDPLALELLDRKE